MLTVPVTFCKFLISSFAPFLRKTCSLFSTTQFYLHWPLFIPAMKKQSLACSTLHMLTAPCLNIHPSSLLCAKQSRAREYEWVWVCVSMPVCVLWCLFLYLFGGYLHALDWFLEWMRMQASSMGHKPTSLQEVKETELFICKQWHVESLLLLLSGLSRAQIQGSIMPSKSITKLWK